MLRFTFSRLALVCTLAGLLVLYACLSTGAPAGSSALPSQQQIAARLGKYSAVTDLDQVRAIVVARDNRIVFQHYYRTTPQTYWDVESVTKSVVSTLIGIAMAEGRIKSLDQTLAELLPRQARSMSAAVDGTTLRQLLTMSGGFPADTGATGSVFWRSRDWVGTILRHPASSPGDFTYSNAGAHLVSAILQQATGMSALAYARSHLFGPLGIPSHPVMDGVTTLANLRSWSSAKFAWPEDPQGINTGWWGLKLRPMDMVKLGQLYLDNGRWHGQQIVPATWVANATTAQVGAASSPVEAGDGYGFLWWTGHADGSPTFTAAGYGGQLLEVVPDRHLVVVTATEYRLDDATSHGIGLNVLESIVENAIISQFPRD